MNFDVRLPNHCINLFSVYSLYVQDRDYCSSGLIFIKRNLDCRI